MAIYNTYHKPEQEENHRDPVNRDIPGSRSLGEAITGSVWAAVGETAQSTMTEADFLLAAVVASCEDAIITRTMEGVILSWNAAAERMCGYSAEEAVGCSVSMLVPPDRPDEISQILERIKRDERIRHYETVRVHKDGTRIDVSLTVSPVKDRSGTIIAISTIARDIRDQKQQQEALIENEERLFQFLEAVPVGLFVIDGRGRPYYANQHAQQVLGKGIDPQFSTGQLAETYQAYLVNTDQPYPVERMPIILALKGEQAIVEDMEIHRPEGRTLLRVSGAPIYNAKGQIVYALAAFNESLRGIEMKQCCTS